jgi:hypothetical protein
MPLRRPILLAAFLLLTGPTAGEPPGETAVDPADEQALRQAGVGTDGPALVEFFRRHSLTADEVRRVEALIAQLGDDSFVRRERATRELVRQGERAAGLLRPALRSRDPEVARRAAECLEEITAAGKGPALPLAAARVLARRAPPGATAALLAYLPFAGDSAAEEEAAAALAQLAARLGPADAALRAALTDPVPLRRGAAAAALGGAPDAAARAAVKPLLQDKDPGVRFQAASALLAGGEKAAVPALIALLSEGPADLADQAEARLQELAGEKAPPASADDSGAKRRAAWARWWAQEGPRLDLARLRTEPGYRGLTLVPEMHANKVWECGRDGKSLWEITNLSCPIDAQVLPGNRLLVAELNGNAVTERDRSGRVLWRHAVNTPIACQRLANGATFIATNHRTFIVGRDGKEISSYTPENGFFIHSVQRLRDGHVVCVSMEGTVREVDAAGKVVCSVTLPIRNGWSGIEGAPGNHYLVVNNTQGQVLEVDRAGKTVWKYQTPGVCYASRLPNGNTLIVSNRDGLIEVDRAGKTVWSRPVPTSLWRAHRR